MTYKHIQALVPNGEHFDESGIINEGGFLSISHLDAIEQTLDTASPALEQANALIETQIATITELNESIVTMQTASEAAATLATTQGARILALDAEVKELGKAPSGNGGSKLEVKEDTKPEGVIPAYLDANEASNKWADEQMARRKKK